MGQWGVGNPHHKPFTPSPYSHHNDTPHHTPLTVLRERLEAVPDVRPPHEEEGRLEARMQAEVRRHAENLLGQLPAVCWWVVGLLYFAWWDGWHEHGMYP